MDYDKAVELAREAAEKLDDKRFQVIAFDAILAHALGQFAARRPTEAEEALPEGATEEALSRVSELPEEAQRVTKLAQTLSVSEEVIRESFDLSGELPAVSVHASQCPGKFNKDKQKYYACAILIAAETAYGKDSLSSRQLKCKLPSTIKDGNEAKNLAKADCPIRITGQGQNLQYRIHHTKYDTAKQMVRELLEAS